MFFFKQVVSMANLILRAVSVAMGAMKFLLDSLSLNWTPRVDIWAVYPQDLSPTPSLSPL